MLNESHINFAIFWVEGEQGVWNRTRRIGTSDTISNSFHIDTHTSTKAKLKANVKMRVNEEWKEPETTGKSSLQPFGIKDANRALFTLFGRSSSSVTTINSGLIDLFL